MTENKPITERDIVWAKQGGLIFRAVDINKMKSAVHGLLEEVELECKPYDFIEVGRRKLSFEEIKDLIKKWFPD